jgi:hypothetical protein
MTRGLRGMNPHTRENLINLISVYAAGGTGDPEIGVILDLKTSSVASLRRSAGIEAGEQRWRGGAR